MPHFWRPVAVSSATQQLDHGFATVLGIICLLPPGVVPPLALQAKLKCFWKDGASFSNFSLLFSAMPSQLLPFTAGVLVLNIIIMLRHF